LLRWLRNVAQIEFSFTIWYRSFTQCFSVISANIAINHILPKTGFSCLYILSYQYMSDSNYGEVIGPKAAGFGEITQNRGHYTIHGHWRSSILVPMERPYATLYIPWYGRLLVHFSLSTGVLLFNVFIRDEPLNWEWLNLSSRNQKNPFVVWCKYFDIVNHLGTTQRVWQTDGWTYIPVANAVLNYVARPRMKCNALNARCWVAWQLHIKFVILSERASVLKQCVSTVKKLIFSLHLNFAIFSRRKFAAF